MTINMTDSHIFSVAQLNAFLKVDGAIKFAALSKKEKYQWIEEVLTKFKYFSLKKKERSIVRGYIMKMTGLGKSQTTELVSRKKKAGRVWSGSTRRHRFERKYSPSDIALLVETDNAHQRLSGQATKTILEREYRVFQRKEYEKVKGISVSHIYNLRNTRQYLSHSLTVKKTNPIKSQIGKRKKPEPQGSPGYLRVDTVHQGDKEKEKGIYHINLVDEVLQWEIVGAVERISEFCLEPLLEALLRQFPFKVLGFHSDNGSEYINKTIAKLLNKLLIEQTKSRARHCNDNGLAEGKNGSIVRKSMGYVHIPRRFAQAVDQFYQQYFNVYLNYHRPCGYATTITDKRGKQKKVYRQGDYQTPYEKLKSLENVEQYLNPGTSFAMLDKMAYAKSDNQFAQEMQKAKEELFKNFKHLPQEMMTFTSFVSCRYVD